MNCDRCGAAQPNLARYCPVCRNRNSHFDRNGDPIGLFQWVMMVEEKNRHVGDDEIAGVRVSTVYLGLDHRSSDAGPPLIFETMIFGGDDDQRAWRWTTEAQARAGHEEIVRRIKLFGSANLEV